MLSRPLNISQQQYTARLPAHGTLVVLAAGTVGVLAWMLWRCHYGISFADETFYLIWMSNPFTYGVSVTQFGFVYHPLYLLLDGNIADLRQANILITFCLSWLLVDVFLSTVFGKHTFTVTSRMVISGAIATSSMASMFAAATWLATPGYNSLTFQSLLVAATGLLLAGNQADRRSMLGWILIGIGGWLAFMGKPTSAAALGLCCGLYLALARKISYALLPLAIVVAAALTIITAYVIDGSIAKFIDRLVGGLEMTWTLGAGHTFAQLLKRIDFQLSELEILFLIGSMVVILLCHYAARAYSKLLGQYHLILSVAFVLASLAIVFDIGHNPKLVEFKTQNFLLFSVTLVAILSGFSKNIFRELLRISRPQWALLITLLTFPFAYAFGSNNAYSIFIAQSGVFGILAGLVLLDSMAKDRNILVLLSRLALAIQIITGALIHTGMGLLWDHLQPVRENDFRVEVGKPGSMLALSRSYGQYITDATHLASQVQFKKGTPMIDLSGGSHGILYAIGASSIGQAWMIGGYPGSEKLAVKLLNKVPCSEISGAWLLKAQTQSTSEISSRVLTSFGANIATDFDVVGTLNIPADLSVYGKASEFLKPIRSMDIAMSACSASRAARQ